MSIYYFKYSVSVVFSIEIMFFRQHGDALKKCEQTMKDAEFYHAEAESIRTRYNEMLIEKQRLENENNSLRLFMEEERKEMSELRR